MATGDTSRSAGAKRTYIIEPLVDGESGEIVQNRPKAQQILDDLLGTVWTVGGSIRVAADRVLVGELPPETEGGRAEPLGETVGLIIEYSASAPLHRSSLTEALLDRALSGDDRAERTPLEQALGEDGHDEELGAVVDVENH